jgi:hypothetical protein
MSIRFSSRMNSISVNINVNGILRRYGTVRYYHYHDVTICHCSSGSKGGLDSRDGSNEFQSFLAIMYFIQGLNL